MAYEPRAQNLAALILGPRPVVNNVTALVRGGGAQPLTPKTSATPCCNDCADAQAMGKKAPCGAGGAAVQSPLAAPSIVSRAPNRSTFDLRNTASLRGVNNIVPIGNQTCQKTLSETAYGCLMGALTAAINGLRDLGCESWASDVSIWPQWLNAFMPTLTSTPACAAAFASGSWSEADFMRLFPGAGLPDASTILGEIIAGTYGTARGVPCLSSRGTEYHDRMIWGVLPPSRTYTSMDCAFAYRPLAGVHLRLDAPPLPLRVAQFNPPRLTINRRRVPVCDGDSSRDPEPFTDAERIALLNALSVAIARGARDAAELCDAFSASIPTDPSLSAAGLRTRLIGWRNCDICQLVLAMSATVDSSGNYYINLAQNQPDAAFQLVFCASPSIPVPC